MPYIRKLPSGRFQATVYHPSGKRVTHTDALKRNVQAWAADQEARFRAGGAASSPEQARRVTVAAWWERWLEARNVESATMKKNLSHWRTHLQPHWGTWPLSSIGRLDVQTWVIGLTRAGVGPNTVVACANLLAGMLSDAVLEGLLPVSPCREIALPKITPPEPRWLTREQYDAVMDALLLAPRAEVWRGYVALGCFAGVRPGELSGLDVTAVDLDRGMARISQVVTRTGLRPYPKTSGSVRWVPFPPDVGALLWPLVADRGSGPVFMSPTGQRVNEVNFRTRVWRPALAAAGVPYLNPYSMRHTAATWMKDAGLPESDIADILGHTSTRMVRIYAHRAPDRFDRVRAAWAGPNHAAEVTPVAYSERT